MEGGGSERKRASEGGNPFWREALGFPPSELILVMAFPRFLYKGVQWISLFFVFVALYHVLYEIHPLGNLVQIPAILLFSLFILHAPLKVSTVFVIGFLSDIVTPSPDGVYSIATLLFFILSTISWKMFHIETLPATLMYLAIGTILFFMLLLVLYSAEGWMLDSRVFFSYWNPLWFGASIGINLFLIGAIYGFIEIKRGALISLK